jgi:two-component system chemotaxis response regulator CheB
MSISDTRSARRDIVVVGASAGGVQALQALVRGLPPDFAACMLVVVHVSPTGQSVLPMILSQAGRLPAEHARDNQRVEQAHIYVAPPDHHLTLKPHGRLAVSRRGPRENGFRPAIDPLFRTAARRYGARVIGVILTGGLDDGTLGLAHIKEHGGVAVAQDPAEAVFPSMPQSAINHVDVDHVLPVAGMASLLVRLVREPLPAGAVAEGAQSVAESAGQRDVAEAGRARLLSAVDRGPPSNITCPECGGTLWELSDHSVVRYECHVGHSYTADSLLEGKSQELEATLWSALRALEESAELRRRLAVRMRNAPLPLQGLREDYQRQAEEAEERASALRTLLGDGSAARRLASRTNAEAEAADTQGNEALSYAKGEGGRE